MEKLKHKLNIQLFAENTDPAVETKATEKVDDSISLGMLDKLKSLFAPTEKQETNQGTQVDDELINKLVNERLSEILPKAKKQKEDELKEEAKKLEDEKKVLELDKQLENVRDEYKEFVKYQAEQKGISIDNFIKENKQYAIDEKVKQTQFQQSTSNGVELNSAQSAYYEQLKKSGIL